MNNLFKKPSTLARFICFCVVLISIIWAYWWIVLILAIVFLFIFPSYYELLFWGVLYDSLYGAPLASFFNFPYVVTLAAMVLFMISYFLRKRLLAYED